MRTKLFLAFALIILLAILSNIVFERLIIGDFNDFIKGSQEDDIYWILASIEGSYIDNEWEYDLLDNALHWALMLGFEANVEDMFGKLVLSSTDALSMINPNMLKRMHSLFKLPSGVGEFTWYPLYVEGEEIGKLHIRPLERLGLIPDKEQIFRRRGREFLVTSFMIAGGGALFLALIFMVFLSNPVRRLTIAAERIAKGDLSGRGLEAYRPGLFKKDEIDRLTGSFNYMAEALRREDAIRRHLASNVAHELRTPLTIIKGNLEAVEDGVISDTDTVIRNIRTEVGRIISLVEGIEDIANAEASFFKKGEPEEINLGKFIESIAGAMKQIFMEKGLFIRTEGEPLIVKTYPEKLHIILKNFLTNSFKFTDKGGVTIIWGERKRDRGKGFYISVKDTGRGIPEEDASRVFERFYKGKDSDGTGLGLAIVKELIEVMEGEVELENSTGNGTKFTVIF
jgi:signal transduction histidine kinase